jgi:hypothetical protein
VNVRDTLPAFGVAAATTTIAFAHGGYFPTEWGWVLLLVVLAAPFVAAARTRGAPGVTAAVAGFAAFVVHAGIDWDFQIVAVTLAGLFCGAALLVAARPARQPRPLPAWARGSLVAALLALVFVAVGMQIGNSALGHARSALDRGNLAAAASDARKGASMAAVVVRAVAAARSDPARSRSARRRADELQARNCPRQAELEPLV